jgi:predicted DNA-binding protein
VNTARSRKATSIRLDAEMAKKLAYVAEIEGVSMSEVVREAIAACIEKHLTDDDFRERLKRHMEEEQGFLKRLAE